MDINRIKEVVEDKEKKYDFNDYVMNYIDNNVAKLEDLEDLDGLREYLEELNEDRELTQAEVIYYNKAMEYLSEHDPSLNESMQIASGFGYEAKDINSELLASLLATQENEEDYQKFIDEVITELED